MLKSADHDSMSGEQVGTTSGLIITSGKSEIWPLAAPENQGFRKLRKSPPREGKRPGKNGYIAYARRQDTAKYAGENIFEFSCCYEHYGLSVRQEESAEMEFPCCYEHC
jgi:hypothetical protein